MLRSLPLRRRVFLSLAAAAALGACTTAERSGPAPVAGRATQPPVHGGLEPSAVQPVLLAVGGGTVGGNRSDLTVYDDGWATVSSGSGMFITEADYAFAEATLRLSASEVDRVRDLVHDEGFAHAEAHYHEAGVMDGGGATFVGGVPLRRIVVVNEPSLPPALAQLAAEARRLSDRVAADGVDPFVDRTLPDRARILLRYDWSGGAPGEGSDRLTVFQDGLLEYRETAVGVVPQDGDYPAPTVFMRRTDASALAALRAAIEGAAPQDLPFTRHGKDDRADSHTFAIGARRLFRRSEAKLEPALQAIVDEVDRLLVPLRIEYAASR